jgi:predicted HicB family RNase H-like nuclease
MVRVEPELHKTIALKARQDGTSLNSWVHDTLAKAAG